MSTLPGAHLVIGAHPTRAARPRPAPGAGSGAASSEGPGSRPRAAARGTRLGRQVVSALLGALVASGCTGAPADPYRADADPPGRVGAATASLEVDVANTTDTGPDPSAPAIEGFGAACQEDADCAVGRCRDLGGARACASACSEDADCAAGWTCALPPAGRDTLCRCAGDPASREDLNAVDDDCDGVVDEDLLAVAFWNVRNLSMASRDDAERGTIVRIMEPYDLIALAEVSDDDVAGALTALLSGPRAGWSGVTSPPVGDTSGSTERFAFVYRSDRVELLDAFVLPERVTEAERAVDREPFAGVFRAGAIDFVLVAAHVVWGADPSARVAEVRALGPYYESLRVIDEDVLVAGDLNRDVGDPESLGWLQTEHGLVDTTDATPPTKVDSDATYDHILLHPERTQEYSGAHGVDLFDAWIFGGDAEAAARAASDHRPVWVALRTDADDD